MKHPLLKDAEERFQKSLSVCNEELAGLHAGRATPALVENVKVNYYGVPTPLKQLAVITAPQSNLLVIKPYDPASAGEIHKAILKANLGLGVQSDGKVVRATVPPLSEERRKQLVTRAKDICEQAKIAMRNVRRDINKRIDQLKKDGQLSEDDAFRLKDEILQQLRDYEKKVDELLDKKENELMNI